MRIEVLLVGLSVAAGVEAPRNGHGSFEAARVPRRLGRKQPGRGAAMLLGGAGLARRSSAEALSA